MSEMWIMELLTSVRDIARQSGYARLAEHLDDGVLIAASEFHEHSGAYANDRSCPKTAGEPAGYRPH